MPQANQRGRRAPVPACRLTHRCVDCGRCELDYLDPRFGLATRLAVEEPGTWPWITYRVYPGALAPTQSWLQRVRPHIRSSHVKHQLCKSGSHPSQAMREYSGVPFPSVVRLEPGMAGVPWAAPRKRFLLVAASFTVRGHGFTLRLRSNLRKSCLANKRCTYMSATNPAP